MSSSAKPPSRPVLRWHGGKWKLAPWIISHFPPHRVYVEPFGGAASVLMRKPRAQAEVWNDLDGELVNLFCVLRGASAETLVRALRLTPFARQEFESAYGETDDPVERARRMVIRSFMGFGSNSVHRLSGFRGNGIRAGTLPQYNWATYPDALQQIIERVSGVVVEHRDAVALMRQHDRRDALFYVDPPYVLSTRGDTHHDYAHELTNDGHAELLAFLAGLQGMVVLSGYPDALYDQALAGWRRVETLALADGARERTEVLWLNPACADALVDRAGGAGTPLFAEVAA